MSRAEFPLGSGFCGSQPVFDYFRIVLAIVAGSRPRALLQLLLLLAVGVAQAQSVFVGVPFVAGAPVLQQPFFDYPREAQARGVSGSAVIAFLVGEDGVPVRHRILETDPPLIFDSAINASVGEFRFATATRDGKPMQYETHVTLAFSPQLPPRGDAPNRQ